MREAEKKIISQTGFSKHPIFFSRINPLWNYEYRSTSNLPLNNQIIQSDLETCSTSDKKITSVLWIGSFKK